MKTTIEINGSHMLVSVDDYEPVELKQPSREVPRKMGILRKYRLNCLYCMAEFATDYTERQFCCLAHMYNYEDDTVQPKPSTKNLPAKAPVLRDNVEKSPEIRKNVVHAMCTDCGKPFESMGHAKYCKDCVKKRQQKGFKKHREVEQKAFEPIGMPDTPAARYEGVISNDGVFMDPYDCAMCRSAQSLCLMHERMAADGAKPLTHRPWPNSPRGKTHL